ncbi:hypothetical protein K435DRAFT_809854 [Dendrothele bispora CBS 962.96]|uniref:Uncharacterized protein n=1 Tax=Dendrothele bispora (strain CBS 962.96) TaxID=1314807 RepID=A0A4V4HBS0_DENBC|nr:hypothetical protein K435DRAFT_809854 [Dendrothele bispora CBS 962.96]
MNYKVLVLELDRTTNSSALSSEKQGFHGLARVTVLGTGTNFVTLPKPYPYASPIITRELFFSGTKRPCTATERAAESAAQKRPCNTNYGKPRNPNSIKTSTGTTSGTSTKQKKAPTTVTSCYKPWVTRGGCQPVPITARTRVKDTVFYGYGYGLPQIYPRTQAPSQPVIWQVSRLDCEGEYSSHLRHLYFGPDDAFYFLHQMRYLYQYHFTPDEIFIALKQMRHCR